MSKTALRKILVELYQRTIDYSDPDRQYIGFLADKSIEIVGEYLKQRPQLPVTQQQLADYCGVSRQTVISWMKNPDTIKLKHLHESKYWIYDLSPPSDSLSRMDGNDE